MSTALTVLACVMLVGLAMASLSLMWTAYRARRRHQHQMLQRVLICQTAEQQLRDLNRAALAAMFEAVRAGSR